MPNAATTKSHEKHNNQFKVEIMLVWGAWPAKLE